MYFELGYYILEHKALFYRRSCPIEERRDSLAALISHIYLVMSTNIMLPKPLELINQMASDDKI